MKKCMSLSSKLATMFSTVLLLTIGITLSSCSGDDNNEPEPQPEPVEMSKALLTVAIQDGNMRDTVITTRAAENLRVVSEAYSVDNHYNIVRHQESSLTESSTGIYTCELDSLPEGDYDVFVWLDNGYYNVQSLRAVSLPDNYANGGLSRKAYYGKTNLSVSADAVAQGNITATSPFAAYRIEALDVERYGKMREANGWPDIKDLEIKVTYDSYFPCSFNVISEKPNDAKQGITYTSGVSLSEDGKSVIASDYVLVNGTESTIRITIDIINSQTGEVISSIKDVDVTYKRGYDTVISGNLLTAGNTNGDVDIDIRWDGSYDVNF